MIYVKLLRKYFLQKKEKDCSVSGSCLPHLSSASLHQLLGVALLGFWEFFFLSPPVILRSLQFSFVEDNIMVLLVCVSLQKEDVLTGEEKVKQTKTRKSIKE